MSERVVAVLDTMDEATAAVARLRREGISRESITTMSSEPLHIEPGDDNHRTSRIAIFAICGGVIGAGFAVLLTVVTSRRVDLVTGGMPIVTPWAFGIIVFELAALGAILATLIRMIFEARLARRGISEYDQAVADGSVVVILENVSNAHHETARQVLGSHVINPPTAI
jgi:hypothetical protein